MINLVVGDVHAVPNELGDCEALLGLVQKTAQEEQANTIIFMGDQYHNHSIVDVRCIEFWKRWIDKLSGSYSLILIVGNHDQVTPTCSFPHALLCHSGVVVVDKPWPTAMGFAMMPYYHDPKEFLEKATELSKFSKAETLFCHQTITGAKYESGFYAKDSVECDFIPFKYVISGHIHTPQTIGKKVLYVGSSRYRILSDAGADRFLWLFEHTREGTKLKKRVPVDTVCRRIYRYVDTEKEPAIINIPENKKALADIRVDIYGSSSFISERAIELKAVCGARCRGFPERVKVSQVSEAEGIMSAFDRFTNKFDPPNKTPLELLKTTVQERLRL